MAQLTARIAGSEEALEEERALRARLQNSLAQSEERAAEAVARVARVEEEAEEAVVVWERRAVDAAEEMRAVLGRLSECEGWQVCVCLCVCVCVGEEGRALATSGV